MAREPWGGPEAQITKQREKSNHAYFCLVAKTLRGVYSGRGRELIFPENNVFQVLTHC